MSSVSDYRLPELKAMAKKAKIKGYSTMNKQPLYNKLKAEGALGKARSRSRSPTRGRPKKKKARSKSPKRKPGRPKKKKARSKSPKRKLCSSGTVKSPDSGRCIAIGGATYKKLVKEGKLPLAKSRSRSRTRGLARSKSPTRGRTKSRSPTRGLARSVPSAPRTKTRSKSPTRGRTRSRSPTRGRTR